MVVCLLCDEGVKYIYGYLGGVFLYIYDVFFKEYDVIYILVCYEQVVIYMVDGYVCVIGKFGVVLVIFGLGVINVIIGIVIVYMDFILMVILLGQVLSNMVGIDVFQEIDMVGIFWLIVKYSFIIKYFLEIFEVIKKVFYLVQFGCLGLVVVDILKDMGDLMQKFEYFYLKKVKLCLYSLVVCGYLGQICKVVEMFLVVKCLVVYFGGGVIMGNVVVLLIELVQMFNLLVINILMGFGGYFGVDCQFFGMFGMYGSFIVNLVMYYSDVIFVVGVCFDDWVINGVVKFCLNVKIIYIDIDLVLIFKIIKVDILIVGLVDSVFIEMVVIVREIGEILNQDVQVVWWKQIDEWCGNCGLFLYDKGDGSIIKLQIVIEMFYEVIYGDVFIIFDVGQYQMFVLQYYKFNKFNCWINFGGFGIMGFGFLVVMGIKFNFLDDDVVCVIGEGSIQMNIQELFICLQYDLLVKIVNLNNGVLGMVCQWQDMQYNSCYLYFYMEFLLDFVKFVEVYGYVGMCIIDLKDLKLKMEEVFVMKNCLVFFDIQVDVSEYVYLMQICDGVMCDMWLSKMECI